MPAANCEDVIRRANAKKRRNAVDSNADAEARRQKLRERRRRRRREEARRRRAVLAWCAGPSLLLALVAFLCTRPRDGAEGGRGPRAKALRDALLSGGGSRKPNAKEPGSMRYLDPRQLPPVPGEPDEPYFGKGKKGGFRGEGDDAWEAEANLSSAKGRRRGPQVDYTKHDYKYPEIVAVPPRDGSYPAMTAMSNVFATWGQDDLDAPPQTLVEVLQHFDYQDPEQMEAAIRYRDLELPFKVYNVPEVIAANVKWTDEYVAAHFNGDNDDDDAPESHGACQQSVDNFFAFHRASAWSVKLLGPPPSLDLDWTYDRWARHAVYADEARLPPTEQHYYWQSGVDREERLRGRKHWTFVSRDLPSFSSPEPTFFGFNPPKQKGIQCRFGERGVTAATHYDGGRNMIAMITGAKRYVLSPPNACPLLGIVTSRGHPSYRHSMLNFGRVTLLEDEDASLKISEREREWLRIAAEAPSLSTVLKSGEVLYIPSHWFHYIISLQKSAQCNTRSGIHEEGNEYWGGLAEVEECVGDD